MTELLQLSSDRGRFGELEPIGVIDIGSNSVRLVVYEGAVRARRRSSTRRCCAASAARWLDRHKLGDEAVGRALGAADPLQAIARILGVKNLRAIATAAVPRRRRRRRTSSPAAKRRCGVPIQILSGEREAELAAHGILMGFADRRRHRRRSRRRQPRADRRRMATSCEDAITLPLGGLRLIDATGGRIDEALDIADEPDRSRRLAGARTRARLLRGRRHAGAPSPGCTWSRSTIRCASCTATHCRPERRSSSARRSARPRSRRRCRASTTSPRPRREVLPYGALVLERLLKRLEPSEVVFSVFGIREGLLYALLSDAERRQGPAAVLLRGLCAPALALRRACARAVRLDGRAVRRRRRPKETDEERRLRHAACLLSDIGWRAHPDYRGEQSLIVIAHRGLGRHRSSRPHLPGADHLLPPHRHRRRRGRRTSSRAAAKAIDPRSSTGAPASSARRSAPPTCSRSAGPASSTRRRSPTSGQARPGAAGRVSGDEWRAAARRFAALGELLERPEPKFALASC